MPMRDPHLQYALIMAMTRVIDHANKALIMMIENELPAVEINKYLKEKFTEICQTGGASHDFLEEKTKENTND